MKKPTQIYLLCFMLVFCTSPKGQNKTAQTKEKIASTETKEVTNSNSPNNITRTIIQDRKGNIWIATFDGIFRYNTRLQEGQEEAFTNMTSEVSSARFFSVLEDRKGNLWFGSIGEGVYHYNGKSFQHFTTEDGLPNNEIVSIYEDKVGNIWFGANGGLSRYDGTSFQNYMLTGDSIFEDHSGKTVPDFTRPPNEVNAIIEDKTGKFWFCTRGNTFVYDGKTFTKFVRDGKAFKNVRWIIEDKKGNIWLGGNDGLWRYNGRIFTQFSTNFVGYIYEDRNGNIWTSSEESSRGSWALSRYDEKSLSNNEPPVPEVKSKEKMIFGILEANDGSIWFGSLNGVHRYDGITTTDFK